MVVFAEPREPGPRVLAEGQAPGEAALLFLESHRTPFSLRAPREDLVKEADGTDGLGLRWASFTPKVDGETSPPRAWACISTRQAAWRSSRAVTRGPCRRRQDDLSVNLPFNSAKLGAEMHSGRSIDLAIVLIGRKTTTVSKVERKDLEGSCEGATHFLQSASVGAFAMGRGTVGKVSAAADLFKVGVRGAGEASGNTLNSDGLLDDCRKSDPDAADPPGQCRAPLRVELIPLGGEETSATASAETKSDKKSTKKAKKDDEAAPVANPCPADYQSAGVMCTRAVDVAHLCKPKDRQDCKAQCEKGSAESCFNLADYMPKGTPDAERAAVYKKACDGGFGDGCAWFSLYARPGDFGVSAMPRWREALKAASTGCAMGSGVSCQFLGDILGAPVDFPSFTNEGAAARAYERGCMLGHGDSCGDASVAYRQGNGVTANPTKAVELLDKACQAGSNDQCADLAELLAEGTDGVTKDLPRAYPIARKACRKEPLFCMQAVKLAIDTRQDDQEIFRLAQRGCPGDDEVCVKLGELYDAGRGTTKDSEKARELWSKVCKDHDDEAACGHLGAAKKPSVKSSAKASAKPSSGKSTPRTTPKPAAKPKTK